MRRTVLFAFGIMFAAAASQAQETAPATPAPQGLKPSELQPPAAAPAPEAAPPESGQAAKPAVARHRHRKSLREKFAAANVTHDGRLTAEQAQASWPSVAQHFAEIDKDHRGYITMAQIQAWRHEHRHRRRKSATGAPASGGPAGTAK